MKITLHTPAHERYMIRLTHRGQERGDYRLTIIREIGTAPAPMDKIDMDDDMLVLNLFGDLDARYAVRPLELRFGHPVASYNGAPGVADAERWIIEPASRHALQPDLIYQHIHHMAFTPGLDVTAALRRELANLPNLFGEPAPLVEMPELPEYPPLPPKAKEPA
ncbi:hypothetical protein NUL63_004576 [Salmonella enterica]|nr:hypothetical protein [Salmonella enterica]